MQKITDFEPGLINLVSVFFQIDFFLIWNYIEEIYDIF